MHRVTTGRLIATVAASGDTVLGTVPAGKVWQVLGGVINLRVKVAGAIGEVRYRDAGGVVRDRVSQLRDTNVTPVVINMGLVNLAAGDQVVFNSNNTSTWGVLVPYFER